MLDPFVVLTNKTLYYFYNKDISYFNDIAWFKTYKSNVNFKIFKEYPPRTFLKVKKIRIKKIRKSNFNNYINQWHFKLCFWQSLIYSFTCLYVNPTFTFTNNIYIPFGGKKLFPYRKNNLLIKSITQKIPLHAAGNYKNDDYLLWKYDRLKFLKIYYGIWNTKELLWFLISLWPFIDSYRVQLPFRFQKNPWRGRRKGTHRRIERFYHKWTYMVKDIITIAEQNKSLIPEILNLIYISFSKLQNNQYKLIGEEYKDTIYSFHGGKSSPLWGIGPEYYYIKLVKLKGGFPLSDKFDRICLEHYKLSCHWKPGFFWKKSYQQLFLKKLMSQLPLPYWNIYSYMIEDINIRNNLILSASNHWASSSHDGHPKQEYSYYKSSYKTIRGLPAERNCKSKYYKKNDFYI